MSFPQLENYSGEFIDSNQFIFHLKITARTMKTTFFSELFDAFKYINSQKQVRCVLLTSTQKHFTTGLDLMEAGSLLQTEEGSDAGRNGINFYNLIKNWQNALGQIQECAAPVIVGIDNFCIGGGVDLISSADIRVCTKNSKFTIKEVDIGLCADIGTTQRLPVICSNDSKLRELMYTGRYFDADEAKEIGLVSSIYKDKQEMLQKMIELATTISEKSPVAVWTIKNVMNHQQQQLTQANMRFMQAINASMLQSNDLKIAGMASIQKEKPVFPKL